jgi:hypothetical protein
MATLEQQCQRHGLAGSEELAQITGRSVRTLQHWWKTSPEFAKIVILGAVAVRWII